MLLPGKKLYLTRLEPEVLRGGRKIEIVQSYRKDDVYAAADDIADVLHVKVVGK